MSRIFHAPAPPALNWSAIGEAILGLCSLRIGLRRNPSVEVVPDALRRDVGLPPREHDLLDPRFPRW